MKKILATVFAGALGVLPSVAVCLKGHLTVKWEYQHSNAVFIGTVLSAKDVPAENEAGTGFLEGVQYQVRVDRTFRGTFPQSIGIVSENSSGRFPMETGRQYLLFVYSDRGRSMVDNCGNSGLIRDSASVLKQIKQIRQGKPN